MATPAQIPQRLGRYAVRRRIGSGGFATVWLAYDEQLDSPVAVKVLADNWTEDAHVRQRFAEEGRYLRKVESPHVVSVYDAGELDDGRPYLVMSYADQGTLADRLENVSLGGFTAAQALEVVRQVGSGLQALHDRDILHRDVKPANVLFRSVPGAGGSGEVRAMLGDLGLGKALDISSRLTMVAGTPSYVAPEQARAEPLDARADQYSLAALTFLLLSGRSPFRHADLGAAATPADPAPLSTPDRTFSAGVEAVVRRGLARDRDDRWSSVSAFVAALDHALSVREPSGDTHDASSGPWLALDPDLTQPGPRPSPAPHPLAEPATVAVASASDPAAGSTPPRRRRRVATLVAAGVLALVAGGGAGWAAWHAADGGEVVVGDSDSVLSATVPARWTEAEGRQGWEPPGGDGDVFPAFSVGTARGWTTAASAQGVFMGLLPGTRLPTVLPQHPECAAASTPIDAETGQGSALTVVHRSCPGGAVTVERVVQVTANRLLWVQVRSADLATANRVLDSVRTSGLR